VQIENHVWKVLEVYVSKVGSQFSFVKRYEAQIMVKKKVGNQIDGLIFDH
jgi:ribosomal protein S6E (S10)